MARERARTPGSDDPSTCCTGVAGVPIVEHLTGLDALHGVPFRFCAVPPAIAGLGTFIVRAFAVTEVA